MRVMVVDDDVQRRRGIEETLRLSGHDVVSLNVSTVDLAASVGRHQPDVILIDVDAPSRDTLESLGSVSQGRPRPMVIFSGQSEPETIRRALRAGVMSYVVDGLELHRIQPIIDVAIARFEQHQAIKQEILALKTMLSDDRDIERAKGLLMARRRVSEEGALAMLQGLAKDRQVSLGGAARLLLKASEYL